MQESSSAKIRTQIPSSQPRALSLYTSGFTNTKRCPHTPTLPHSHMHRDVLNRHPRKLARLPSGSVAVGVGREVRRELLLRTVLPCCTFGLYFYLFGVLLFCVCVVLLLLFYHEHILFIHIIKINLPQKGDSGPNPLPTHT